MTEIEQVDVLIVGSGPAGTSTALHLAQKDRTWAGRTVMLDKAVHPREKLCGGGLTYYGEDFLTRLGLTIAPDSFEVQEVRFVNNQKQTSLRGNPVFRVVRRDEFDHWLVNLVEKEGVLVRQGEAVTGVTAFEDYVEVVTAQNTFRTKILVAADGSRSFVRRALEWPDRARLARLLEVLTPEDAQIQPDFADGVATFDFSYMADHVQGYYWDFPSYVAGEPTMNRGVFDSRVAADLPKADLTQVMRDALARRGRDLADYELKGHPILRWDSKARLAIPRVLLVGDAAGVDPLLGEGISFALAYGKIAAATIFDAFRRDDFSFATYKKRLVRYPLFVQLELRTRMAQKLLTSRNMARAGGQLSRWLARYTPG